MPKTIYKDTDLLSYCVPFRQNALRAAGDTTTVVMPFIAGSFKEAQEMLQSIQQLTEKAAIPKAESEIFKALNTAGLVDNEGKAIGDLEVRLRAQPKFEFIYRINDEHYAAISLSKEGIAYVDSKGAACPNHSNPSEARQTLTLLLQNFWSQTSGTMAALYRAQEVRDSGSGTPEEKKKRILGKIGPELQWRAEKASHFHNASSTDIKQQETENNDSLGWVLANLAILNRNIAAKPGDLKKAKKVERKDIVEALNKVEDPKTPGLNFDLEYKDESKDQSQWDNDWLPFYTAVKERASVTVLTAQKLSQDETRDRLPSWAKSALERNAHYIDPEKLQISGKNLYEYVTTDNQQIKNEIKTDADGKKITTHSTGGDKSVTYRDRFKAIAEDLLALLGATYNESTEKWELDEPVKLPLESIHPPREAATCQSIFEDLFVSGSVVFREPEPKPKPKPGKEEDADSIEASALAS